VVNHFQFINGRRGAVHCDGNVAVKREFPLETGEELAPHSAWIGRIVPISPVRPVWMPETKRLGR
jgi:hypothetical protein